MKSISTQKAHKTCYKQGSILHYLGTNQYVPTKRKAYHGCSIRVGTEEEIKRTGHSTPAIRAISEIGAHQHYFRDL